MKYELELFSRIITGDLSPLSVGADNFNKYISYLRTGSNHCIKYYKIRFHKKAVGKYILKSHREYSFLDFEQTEFLDNENSGEDQELLNALCTQSIPKLNIHQNDIIGANLSACGKCIDLHITVKIEYEDLKHEEARFLYYNKLMHEEAEGIKNNLNHEVFRLHSEKEIGLYIQNHQIALETLMRVLFELLSEKERKKIYDISKAYSVTNVYKKTYSYLDDLLRFIEKYFTKHLDVNLQISYQSRIVLSSKAQKKLQRINAVVKKSSISKPLLDILFIPLNKIAHLTEKDYFTYQDLIYHKKFLRELYMILDRKENEIHDELIISALQGLNYNSLKFFNYIITGIKKELKQEDGLKEKVELLYHYKKIYNQCQVKTRYAYNCSLPSLKQQVTAWLKEEVSFLKKKLKDREMITHDPHIKAKMITQMSVAQLSYFTKVLYEIGEVSNKNQREVFRFLSSNICTRKQQDISATSISVKYYNVEHTTKLAVKDIVIRMLNHINKRE